MYSFEDLSSSVYQAFSKAADLNWEWPMVAWNAKANVLYEN